MKRGKKYLDNLKKFDRTVQYDKEDAIKIVKENATASFRTASRIPIYAKRDIFS